MAARVSLGWGQKELAEAAGVSLTSIRKLEALPPSAEPLDSLRPSLIKKIVTALQDAGVEFTYEQGAQRLGISFYRSGGNRSLKA